MSERDVRLRLRVVDEATPELDRLRWLLWQRQHPRSALLVDALVMLLIVGVVLGAAVLLSVVRP